MNKASVAENKDPTLLASFSLRNRLARAAWTLCWALLYRTSPRPFHAWRALLLSLFGATLGPDCHFYPKSRVWAPWNLICEDRVTLGDDAELYNPARFYLASHCIISQGAYICGASHDYNDLSFRLVAYPMKMGAYAWICAKAIVHPKVKVGTGAILGLGSLATADLEPFGIYAGNPAVKVKERLRASVPPPYDRLQA